MHISSVYYSQRLASLLLISEWEIKKNPQQQQQQQTQHLSWKNCTGFPFQKVLKSLVCVSVLWMVLVLLTFLNCYMSTLHLVCYALLPTPACWKSSNKNACHGFCAFSCFGPHIWNSLPQDLGHYSTPSSFEAKLKTFLFSQYFHPNWYQYPVSATVIVCVCVCECACVHVSIYLM